MALALHTTTLYILVADDIGLVGHTPKITYGHVICSMHPRTPCHLCTCHLLDGPPNVFDVCSENFFLSTHQRHWKVHGADDRCILSVKVQSLDIPIVHTHIYMCFPFGVFSCLLDVFSLCCVFMCLFDIPADRNLE